MPQDARGEFALTTSALAATAVLALLLGLGTAVLWWNDATRHAAGPVHLTTPLPGPGQTVVLEAHAVAVRRRADGSVVALRLRCPDLGCRLQHSRRGFVCPCHGDRFGPDGQARSGRAAAHMNRFGIRAGAAGVVIDRSVRYRMVGRRIPPDRQFPGSSARIQ